MANATYSVQRCAEKGPSQAQQDSTFSQLSDLSFARLCTELRKTKNSPKCHLGTLEWKTACRGTTHCLYSNQRNILMTFSGLGGFHFVKLGVESGSMRDNGSTMFTLSRVLTLVRRLPRSLQIHQFPPSQQRLVGWARPAHSLSQHCVNSKLKNPTRETRTRSRSFLQTEVGNHANKAKANARFEIRGVRQSDSYLFQQFLPDVRRQVTSCQTDNVKSKWSKNL